MRLDITLGNKNGAGVKLAPRRPPGVALNCDIYKSGLTAEQKACLAIDVIDGLTDVVNPNYGILVVTVV